MAVFELSKNNWKGGWPARSVIYKRARQLRYITWQNLTTGKSNPWPPTRHFKQWLIVCLFVISWEL